MKIKRHFWIFSFIFLFAGSVYFSCSNISSTGAQNIPEGKVRLCGNLSLPQTEGAVPEEVAGINASFQNNLNGSSDGRAATFTNPDINDTTKYEYYVEAVCGSTTITEATWTSNGSAKTFSMELDYGSWEVEAGIKEKGSDTIIYSSKEPVSLQEGGPKTYSKAFVARPGQSGKGYINLNMQRQSDFGISFVRLNFISGNEDNWNYSFGMPEQEIILNVPGGSFNIGSAEKTIKSGTYTIGIEFYNDPNVPQGFSYADALEDVENGKAVLIYSTIQTINIYDNLTTNRWVSSGNSNNSSDNPILTDGSFCISNDLIDNYTLTNICVSSSGSDTNFGTVYNPYKTMTKALSYINERGSTSKDFTISVSGEVSGDVDISLASKAKSITIKGKSGNNANDKLKGSGNDTVLKINTTIPVTIENLTITGGKNSSGNGGGISLSKSGAKVILGDGALITANQAKNGAGVYVMNGTTLEITGSALMTANKASTSGGAVYNEGIFTMTAGTIGGSESSSQNSILGTSGTGGAVYQSGTFNISGTAYICPGSEKTNDVYLLSSKFISVGATWTGSQSSNKMVITPASWVRGTQVLDGSKGATYYSYFTISDSEWMLGYTSGSTWSLTDALKIRIGADIWVAGTSNTASGVGSPNDSNKGTKSAPYASLQTAVEKCWDSSLNFKINLSGKLTQSQTISAANSTNGTGLAKSILLKGVTGNSKDIINPSSGCALKINNTAPFSIQDIQITGGSNNAGGGIYVSHAKARLTLKTGALVTGNSATNGGGIYFAGSSGTNNNGVLIMESGSQISKNTTTSNGGGVYLYYADLCMAGTAIIGSTTTTIADSQDNSHSNKAGSKGGGVYCDSYSTLWLGYSEPSDNKTSSLNDGRGVVYNYSEGSSSNGGGGIYVTSSATVKINSGDVAYNKAIYAASNGGGIYSVGTVIISGGRVIGNGASGAGGIYNDGTLWLKGGAIGAQGAVNVNSSGIGDGIYNTDGSTFKVSGSPGIYSGNKVECNSPIQVAGPLDGNDFVCTFIPSSYSTGTKVVEMAQDVTNPTLANVAGRFALKNSTYYAISAEGKIISNYVSFSAETESFKNYYNNLPNNTAETPIKLQISSVSNFQTFADYMYEKNLTSKFVELDFSESSFTKYQERGGMGSLYTKITLPASCSSVVLNDFSGSNLKEINVASNNTSFMSVNGVLYSKNGKTLVWYPGKKEDTSYTVRSGTETIGEHAFNNNSVLTSLTICSGVKKMEERCLEGCSAITSLSLPATLTEIGDFAIWCSKLKTLTIPAGVNTIGINFISNCSSLESMSVSSSNTSFMMKDGMLYSKDGKTIVACPAKLNKTSYVIPYNVTKICSRTFCDTSFKANISFNSNYLTGWKKYSEDGIYQRDIDATQSALNAAVCESTGYLVRQ